VSNKYEGLFILNTAGKEEGVKEMIDRLTEEIGKAGGKVETVQKMDKRPFSRIANKRYNNGYYVNVIFEAPATNVSQMRTRFGMIDDVFRVMFTKAPAPKKNAPEAVAA
jgi:small subunit ribosomal protein S6